MVGLFPCYMYWKKKKTNYDDAATWVSAFLFLLFEDGPQLLMQTSNTLWYGGTLAWV